VKANRGHDGSNMEIPMLHCVTVCYLYLSYCLLKTCLVRIKAKLSNTAVSNSECVHIIPSGLVIAKFEHFQLIEKFFLIHSNLLGFSLLFDISYDQIVDDHTVT